MKNKFKITGLYYELQGYKFRKYLDIKLKTSYLKTPDLMVVMMNPGSSRPMNGIDNNTIATEAVPDNTQSQIMKVMLNTGFNFARVLNLSDLREPKSEKFYPKIKEMESKNISHSIFDDSRKEELNNLWIDNIPVIFGWGVSYRLKTLAMQAIKVCDVSNPYGLKKLNFSWAYYHPLPPNTHKQNDWVDSIIKIIKK